LTLPEVVQYLPGVRDAGKAGRDGCRIESPAGALTTKRATKTPRPPKLLVGWDRARLRNKPSRSPKPPYGAFSFWSCEKKNKDVRSVGATGAVAANLSLHRKPRPAAGLAEAAGQRQSAGKTQMFSGQELVIEELTERAFRTA